MQHKSLFAALLCGALCLTACLKNEESPSVTLVRNAKADEILANAEKLRAEAAATITLANAEAKLKEANAKLAEANAKLAEAEAAKKEAEAKQILVEAEYAQVQVDIAKVQLDEEKVELQRKQAELEKLIAEYQAAIAEAEANKKFWENRKAMYEKDLEIALVLAQAALTRAQADLVAAQAELEAAIRAAEEAAHDAEIAANEKAAQELEDLRQRVLELAAKYYNESLQVLDYEHQLIDEQILITKAENGLVSAGEIAGEMIGLNNREIARIEKMIEFLETLAGEDPEDLKDQIEDLVIQAAQQAIVVDAAQAAYLAVYEEMMNNAPNAYGHTDPEDYPVTYTYTCDFFTDPELSILNDYMELGYVYDETTGDLVSYSDAGILYGTGSVLMDNYGLAGLEEDNYYELFVAEHYDFATGQWETDYFDQLFNYYYDGGPIGMKTTPVRYPELEEGICYDEREPYMVYDNYEFIPLEINREGFEAYVDYENAIVEVERQQEIDDINLYYDENIDYYNQTVEYYQKFVDVQKATAEKVRAEVDQIKDDFVADWEAVKALYDAYNKAANEYYKKYELEAGPEANKALVAYLDALTAYEDAFYGKPAKLTNDIIAAAADLATAQGVLDAAKKAKTDFEADDAAYALWQLLLYAAKVNQGDKEGAWKQAQKDVETAQTAYNTAKAAYDAQVAAYDATVDAYYVALQKAADARQAWLAAGSPDPSTLKDAMDAAETAATNAGTTMSSAESAIAPLKTAMDNAKLALDAANTALMGSNGKGDTDGAYFDYVQANKALEETANYYPGSFDKAIADAQADVDAAQTKLDAANAANDAYDAEVAKLEKAKNDAFDAWKKVAGNEEEWKTIWGANGLYDKFIDAANNLENPFREIYYTYGLIGVADYGYPDDSDPDFWTMVYDSFDEADWFWLFTDPAYATDPDASIEDYIEDVLYEAYDEYFGSWLPSAAYTRYYDIDYDTITENGDGTLFIEWLTDPEDYSIYKYLSPLGVMYLCEAIEADIDYITSEPSFMDIYEEYRQEDLDACNEYYDAEIAANEEKLARLDDILAYEDVYKAAIDELNALAAQLPDLAIAYFNEEVKLYEIADQLDVLYNVTYAQAVAIKDAIAACNDEIATLEEDNATWEENVTELEHALTILKGKYALDQEMYEVAKTLVESYKAEYEAAFAELKATLE